MAYIRSEDLLPAHLLYFQSNPYCIAEMETAAASHQRSQVLIKTRRMLVEAGLSKILGCARGVVSCTVLFNLSDASVAASDPCRATYFCRRQSFFPTPSARYPPCSALRPTLQSPPCSGTIQRSGRYSRISKHELVKRRIQHGPEVTDVLVRHA